MNSVVEMPRSRITARCGRQGMTGVSLKSASMSEQVTIRRVEMGLQCKDSMEKGDEYFERLDVAHS